MSKKEMLENVLADYERHECKQIELVWNDGTRAGIGNKQAINVAMTALKAELKRQMNEEESK